MVVGGILAGGVGSRMENADMPKQFLELNGIPIIVRTLRAFLEEEKIQYIVVAMNPDWMEYCSGLLQRFEADMDRIRLIEGAADRFGSMENIIRYCSDVWGRDCVVVVHDCARPFVSKQILSDNIDLIKEYDMVTTSVPTIDTVVLSPNGRELGNVPERSKVFLDQGPQTVIAGDFLTMAEAASPEQRKKYIEAGKLYLDFGKRIGIVAGDRTNFKITTQFDLDFAEFLLKKDDCKGK